VLVTNADGLVDVPTWHRTRMIIVGDAAHAASPATGQGASMALEDAALRDQPDPASAPKGSGTSRQCSPWPGDG